MSKYLPKLNISIRKQIACRNKIHKMLDTKSTSTTGALSCLTSLEDESLNVLPRQCSFKPSDLLRPIIYLFVKHHV